MPIQTSTATMDLLPGESYQVPGKPYIIRNIGGVYDCSCSSWRNCADTDTPRGAPSHARCCKHTKALRGRPAELARIAEALGVPSVAAATSPMATPIANAFTMADIRSTAPEVAAAASVALAEAEEPEALRANAWDGERDLTGWLWSEKLKGVRARWDGREFVSRLGNVFRAPAWFKIGLPVTMVLDGEIHTRDRRPDSQEIANGCVHSGPDDPRWQGLIFSVFDAPEHPGAFRTRIAEVHRRVSLSTWSRPLPHSPLAGNDHARAECTTIVHLGGEGVIARDPGAPHVSGRTDTVLKIKPRKDAEAVIVAHIPGKKGGRHEGRLGAFRVERPDGVQFNVGTGMSDAVRENPPPEGTVITYSWTDESSKGIPQPAAYEGVAPDRPWTGRVVAPEPAAAKCPAGKAGSRPSVLEID
jgi:DNA ligase-1